MTTRQGDAKRALTAAAMAVLMALVAGAPNAFADQPGAGKTVKASRAGWDTFWFAGEILRIGLEELGYEVEDPVTLTSAARYPALAAGDVHYTSDVVMPNESGFIEKAGDAVELLGPIMQPGSIQGYLVDRKTAEAHGITHLDDIKRPEIGKLFDRDDDGKADLVGCNPGWSCEAVINHHFGVYDLGGTMQHLQGEYNVLVGDAVARYRAGEPIFIYAWYPNTATVEMAPGEDLVWLQVSKTDLPSGVTDTALSGITGCAGGADPCNTGWSATTYLIGGNSDWLAENPAARSLFASIRMDLADRVKQNLAMKAGEDSEEDLRRHAEEWIAAHRQDFDSWLDAARAAAQ